MNQTDTLALKSSIKLMYDLLNVTTVLPQLESMGIISAVDLVRINGIDQHKEQVTELIKLLVTHSGGAFQAFLQVLQKTAHNDVPHQKLRKLLMDTSIKLTHSPNLAKEDATFRCSLSVRGAQEEGASQLSALIQEEFSKSYTGSARQTLVIEYGLLVKRVELPQLALVCQLQLDANYARMLSDITNKTFGQKIWAIFCEKPAFMPFKEKWTLSVRLAAAEEERLIHFKHVQNEASDEEEDEDENQTVSGGPTSYPNLSTMSTTERTFLHPIPVSQMEQPQKVVWNLLLSYITGGQQNHFRHFYHAVRKCIGKADIALLCSNEGFTLFHEVIRNKRADFMQVFQYFGLLNKMYSTPVTGAGGEYANIMPTELAARLNVLKERNEMENLIKIEKSLMRDSMKQACRNGDVRAFKERSQIDRNRVTLIADNRTCLDWAIVSGSVEMVEEVIKAEKNIGYRRQDNKEQVRMAVILGHEAMIRKLLDYVHTNIDSIDVDGKSLMERTAEFGDIETFNCLKLQGASVPETTLAVASSCGKLEFVRYCLNNYMPQLNVNFQDKRQKTALHFATERGHPAVIDLLLSHGADLMLKDKRGRTMLHSAAENGKIIVLEKIIQHARDRNKLEGMLSSQDVYLGSELCFLVRGRDQEMSAWHYVQVDRGVLDIFRIKTRGGAVDVAQFGKVIRSGWGTNPSEEIVEEVEAQFDMANIPGSAPRDMLPLHVAILKNNPECAVKLIELTTNINKADCFGLTPLHYACMRGDVQVVAALDNKQADRSIREKKGRTAVQLADLNKHTRVLEYMRSGSLLQSMQTFLDTNIAPVLDKLSTEELQRRSQDGENMKQYIKNILRDLVGDVNGFLFDEIKTGPVMEESSSNM